LGARASQHPPIIARNRLPHPRGLQSLTLAAVICASVGHANAALKAHEQKAGKEDSAGCG
jgi:hypothetical protein